MAPHLISLSLLLSLSLCLSLSLSASLPPRTVSFDFVSPPPAGSWSPLNGAAFSGGRLLLNADEPLINAAAYLTQQVWIDRWKASFFFELGFSASGARNGGLAFVLQGDGIRAGPNDAGIGYGSRPGLPDPGIARSVVVEFDTLFDPGVDDTIPNCEAPHFALHSRGPGANSAIESEANIGGCFNRITNPYSQPGMLHNVTLAYDAPFLYVYYDQTVLPLLKVSFDVGSLQLPSSLAWLGFTSSTGPQGGDSHAIKSMSFEYLSSLAPGRSQVTGLAESAVAGGLASFAVQSMDEFGHPYPFGGGVVNVSVSNVATGKEFFFSFDGSSNNGTYVVTFNCTRAGDELLTVTLNGAPVQGSPFALRVVAGSVSPPHCSATGFGFEGAEAGQPTVATVVVRDAFGNPTNASAEFVGTTLLSIPGNQPVHLDPPQLTATGEWSYTYTARETGLYQWHVVVNGATLADAPRLSVSSGAASAVNSTVAGLNAATVAGVPMPFNLTLYDAFGNRFARNASVAVTLQGDGQVSLTDSYADGVYSYVLVVFTTGTYVPSVLVSGSAVTNGVPSAVTVLSGPVSPSNSLIVWPLNATIFKAAGELVVTEFEARDAFGNLQSSFTGYTWAIATNGEAKEFENGDKTGVVVVKWRPKIATTYITTATINGVAVQYSGRYEVVVSANPKPDVEKTLVSGTGASAARVNQQATFWAVVRDSFGNVILTEQAVNVTITDSGLRPVPVGVAWSAANASYTVTYVPTSAGVWFLELRVDGDRCCGGQLVINVAAALSAGEIVAIVFGCIGGVALIVAVIILYRRKKRVYQPL